MKKTMVTAVALAACMSTQLFAQNTKEDTIKFALTTSAQSSVSTSTSPNAGNWSDIPTYYKTVTKKMTQTDILRAIAYVLHGKNANYYSSKASLVLVQGELSGFFNISEELADAQNLYVSTSNSSFTFPDRFESTSFDSSVSQTDAISVRLATGRHFEENPETGAWPPGHHQPWGQIFVKDPGKSPMLCENVTFFFNIEVEECYDCFYLNSFISDATFKYKEGTSGGPPCCDVPEDLTGNGKDRYYMYWSFDNTEYNSYLDPYSYDYVGYATGPYPGIEGIPFDQHPADGVHPDPLEYSDAIRSQLGSPNPYQARFTLNGIVTYTWSLKFVNKDDLYPDFVGSAKYDANGYGFIGLTCVLITGTANITEKIVAQSGCCLDLPWYDWWYGIGAGYGYGLETPVNVDASLSWHYVPSEGMSD